MNRIRRNVTGLSRLAWTTGIAVGASLPHWTSLPPWIPGLLLFCVGWRFAARLLHWPLPGTWLIGAITIAAFVGVLLQFGTINGLVPGTALLVVMVSLKFLEARTQRDQIVLTVICYFLVFASLLAGGSPFRAVYLVAFVWITTIGLIQVGRTGPLLKNLPTARLGGKLLLQALPLMIVLFLLFPRLQGSLWSLPGENTSGISGLSASMSPGDITNLGLSDVIAFRVEFEGQAPEVSELYWRGPVLTAFDGRSWALPQGTRGDKRDTIEYRGDANRYRITLEPEAGNWAFALEMPSDWDTGAAGNPIRMSSDYQLVFSPRNDRNRRRSYEVTSYSEFSAREPLRAEEISFFTRLPAERNPRTRALVEDWLAESRDPDDVIRRIFDLFREDDYYYTLTPPPLGEHSVDDFIFETKEGFCEHYASALAVVMRMAGVPARVVTGYQGGELNRYGDYYIVRQANAHAWTEVWTGAAGWRRVDPVTAIAPGRIELGSAQVEIGAAANMAQRIGRMTILRQLALSWDAANTFWNNWVIDYGPRLQRDLLEKLGFSRISPQLLLLLSVAATAVGMIGLSLYFGLRLRQHRARDSAALSFRKFGRKLKRCAIDPIRPGETPTAFAARAASYLPEAADQITAITRTYLSARYEPDADDSARARLHRLVREFRPGYVPAWR